MSSPALAARQSGISRLGYAIQMGAFADVKNAERFTNRLQAKGLDAFYYRKDSGIYAVRFGDFPSKDKARAAARQTGRRPPDRQLLHRTAQRGRLCQAAGTRACKNHRPKRSSTPP